MLTHLGGNRYEFLMQLLIIKDLVVVAVDSYEGLPKSKIRRKLFLFCFFNRKDKSKMCDGETIGGGVFLDRLQGLMTQCLGFNNRSIRDSGNCRLRYNSAS